MYIALLLLLVVLVVLVLSSKEGLIVDGECTSKGFQALGGKLWRCNNDPNDLTTVGCGPNDYSLWKDYIVKKITYNETLEENSGDDIRKYPQPSDEGWWKKRWKRKILKSGCKEGCNKILV